MGRDAFDAITSDRPYRKGRSAEEAVAEISKMAGTQFDPAVVKALKQYLASRSLHSTRLAA
jgi:HD-GYP domain-containing protein (c-di-GMP phosphodiesterase class II)